MLIFAAVDKVDHVYTWDYTEYEKVESLYEFDDFFLFITHNWGIDDETGAMGDYRNWSRYNCYKCYYDTFDYKKILSNISQEALIGEIEVCLDNYVPVERPTRLPLSSLTIYFYYKKIFIEKGNLILRCYEEFSFER